MTIKDFATLCGVNSSTINAYIRRNPDKFDGHLTLAADGKTRILDDTALAILKNQYGQHQDAVQIITPDPDAAKKEALIKDQQQQIEKLIAYTKQLESDLATAKQYQIALSESQEHAKQLIERTNQLEKALESQQKTAADNDKRAAIAEAQLVYEQQLKEKAEAELQEKTDQLTEAEKRAKAAEAEANSYVRSWFGFFRKRKKQPLTSDMPNTIEP